MTIAFACPNGHPLTAPENLAGKPGQCPRCNTRFLIPTLEEVAAAAGDSAGGEPANEASSAAVSTAPPAPPAPPAKPTPSTGAAAASPAGASPSPAPPGAATSPAGGSPSATASAASGATPAKATSTEAGKIGGPAPAAPPGTMVFFCPNGHRLNGPTSLRGKLGQCPHCQTKFRIPAEEGVTADPRWQGSPEPQAPPRREESSADAGAAPPVAAGSSGSASTAPTAAPPPARPSRAPETTSPPPPRDEDSSSLPSGELVDEDSAPETSDGAVDDNDDVPLVEPLKAWEYPPPPPGEGNRLVDLVTWLWTQRDANSYVELRLKDGEIFAPTWFAPDVSQQLCAVFATQHDDNRFSIRLILWENIVEVNVRQLEEIPLDLFV